MLRIALAEISQETDTFNPILSVVKDFKKSTFLVGNEIVTKEISNDIPDGSRIFFSDKKDVKLLPVLMAKCVAGGKLKDEAVEYFKDTLVSGLQDCLPIDGLILSVHGATISESIDDVSGYLLAAAREVVGEDTLIVAPLDHHANITELILTTADFVVGHETQPHDLFGTGMKTALLMYDFLNNKKTLPVKAWVKIPMIAPQDQFLTSSGPMKEWFDMARRMEELAKVVSISLFPMQPWVDAQDGGWAAVVYTVGDEKLALNCANSLGNYAWENRSKFWVSERVEPEDAVWAAVEADQGTVLLSDMGDAVYGGGTGDSTCLLKVMLESDVPVLSYVPLVDPEAVEIAIRAGLSNITLTIGGENDPFSEPLTIQGWIAAISEGLKLTTQRGITEIGKAALFEAGNIRIILLSNRTYAINQPILYTHLGLKIEDAKIIVLKTGSNFQYFDPWRKELIRVNSPGATQSTLKDFTWTKLPRPIYPLDSMSHWVSEAQILN
ncbi:MAG: M81 family metallopeptidase [Bacteroidetes bacterium]|nr:M81 family metallopeptidase [Bacteroidota bacterium]